jgi:hypothetical protein
MERHGHRLGERGLLGRHLRRYWEGECLLQDDLFEAVSKPTACAWSPCRTIGSPTTRVPGFHCARVPGPKDATRPTISWPNTIRSCGFMIVS